MYFLALLLASCCRGPSRPSSSRPTAGAPSPVADLRTRASRDRSPPLASSPPQSHPAELAQFYASLFEPGKVLTFPAEIKVTSLDLDTAHPRSETQRGKVTCRVVQVGLLGRAHLARLGCEGLTIPLHFDTPAGDYVATDDGLWRVDDWPTRESDLAKLGPETMLLGASPKPGQKRRSLGDSPECEEWQRTRAFLDGFCTTRGSACGDDGSVTLCFSRARGLIGGHGFVGGGSTRELRYGEVPPDP